MKHTDISIVGIPERTESEQGIDKLFEEIMTNKFPYLLEEKDTEIQEA